MNMPKLQNTITVDDIHNMSYVDFISFLDETNRCPGGKQTIRRILQNSFIDRTSRVLEIGSNTGFSSLEVARTAKCSVFGIDPVKSAVEISKSKLLEDTEEIKKLVHFEVGSAYEIPSQDNIYDLIISGGATSFMDDKNRAVSEYFRVLKSWGFLSVAHFYYKEVPPKEVIQGVSDTIGVEIQPWTQDDWMNLFKKENLFEIYWTHESKIEIRSEKEIDQYVQMFIEKSHISSLDEDVKEAVYDRWKKTIIIFNENHKYTGFQIVLFRKAHLPEEMEIFSEVKNS